MEHAQISRRALVQEPPPFLLESSAGFYLNKRPFHLEEEGKKKLHLPTSEILPALRFTGKEFVMQKLSLKETF